MANSQHCGRRMLSLLSSAHLLWPFIGLFSTLLATLLTLSWLFINSLSENIATHHAIFGVCLLQLISIFIAINITGHLCQQLLRPLVNLEHTVARVCQGEPGASESLCHAGVLTTMARDISSLNAELTELYEDMDARVARQTLRLAQKTASLKILYDVAASINQAEGLEAMLLRFLRILKQMVNGRAATVRLLFTDGKQQLIGSIGLNDDLIALQPHSPLDLCLCGTVLCPGDILCKHDARYCSRVYGRQMFNSDQIEVVTVPLKHQEQLFGVYTIFVDRPGVTVREDILELLATIGQHIGVAIAKQRSDDEARRLSIIDERNALAHELHDSLAQTLASLRLQMRMLEDGLKTVTLSPAVLIDLNRMRNGIDEAHHELRELLANFRAPLEQHGLLLVLKQLADRFQQETTIHTLFHSNCHNPELSAAEELHVIRIAQEALHNIRKHAQAQTVRIVLMREANGVIQLVIEDDGIGFIDLRRTEHQRSINRSGEHIGLSILEDRARRIGGELTLESEPGEGTRIELRFHHAAVPLQQVKTYAHSFN
ncbi:GAF domain-containing sensor histidine kinase [Thiospirillum jenense]|uniref:Sensor protein n=1 Tax=Thiospirillum jenense TaxID=1653858 RepID=A0A839HJS9_9GAMM|nr:ATP-binding protein [Thiospirillum jenense]MBB1126977.1 GAF domain-containing protein [Thiospirillum jenense]